MNGIRVGLLELRFTEEHRSYPINFPPWHSGFKIDSKKPEVFETSVFYHSLQLQLEHKHLLRSEEWDSLISRNNIWELWTDKEHNFILTNPMQPLHRQIIINQQFTRGMVIGKFNQPSKYNYPLPQDLEIVFFVNWLGHFKDLILHASGMVYEGKGFVFAGRSGVGKSTLAASLAKETGVTILGEDQVVLRLIDDKFWIFGTPWHENRSLCSPMGVPLEKVFFLEKKGIQIINKISQMEGVTRLLQTALIPYYRPEVVKKLLERLELLSERVPMNLLSYELGSNVFSMMI